MPPNLEPLRTALLNAAEALLAAERQLDATVHSSCAVRRLPDGDMLCVEAFRTTLPEVAE